MQKKHFFQILVLILFIVIAAGSSKSSYPTASNNSSNSTHSNNPPLKERVDFPAEPCHTCKGRKGYYDVLDNWHTCNRCKGTGKEPQH